MLSEYFKIVHRFHSHRDHPQIRKTTKLQLEMLRDRSDPRMFVVVNLFLTKNFSEPNAKTG
jgi:hypothetical protein